jgi:DNA-binding response OmpR family regulator
MVQKQILIVDDDPYIRLALGIRLKANHYDVVYAGDGSEAMQEAQKQQPDLVILDLGLPGEDGFGVLAKLKTDPAIAAIPIIVLSGRDPRASMERALKGGARNFFQKPIENYEILTAVKEALMYC